MSNPIETFIQGDVELSRTRLRIINLERWLFRSYEPNKFQEGDFDQRLIKWLNNVPTSTDKKTLFQLLVHLFYVGPVEFEELYRCAYEGPVARWLIDCDAIDVCSPNAQINLQAAARTTWFCPVTDSFRINAFFHINNLAAGGSLRPDWRSLLKFGDASRIQQFCTDQGIKRLVLLEDFVGGGSQSLAAVEFAAQSLPGVKVLFVPLIICPDGASNTRKLEIALNAASPDSMRYEAVVELPADAFLTRTQRPSGLSDNLIDEIRNLVDRTYPLVSGGASSGKPYDPYGFPISNPTGGLVVMYSNTPDNTLPVVHWRPKQNTWEPIFPRHSRD